MIAHPQSETGSDSHDYPSIRVRILSLHVLALRIEQHSFHRIRASLTVFARNESLPCDFKILCSRIIISRRVPNVLAKLRPYP